MNGDYKSKDPFPEIESALLNSADIQDYISATKMIAPFDPSKLKSASYEIGFEGVVYYWDEKGNEYSQDLDKEPKFNLKKNSIAFLFTKTKFCLPDYMALRFNLRISHVHRGILLGTGPLIDPGFEGNLLIPLHNLTTNDYEFQAGEGLIWVEFTKLSYNSRWANEDQNSTRSGQYREFPNDKKNKDAKYYFGKAAWGRGIRSSIPDAMRRTADDAKEAQESAKKMKKSIRNITIASVIGVLIVFVAISVSLYLGFQPVLQLVQDSITYVKNEAKLNSEQQVGMSIKVESLEKKLTNIEDSVKKDADPSGGFAKKLQLIETEINELKTDIKNLKKILNESKIAEPNQ